MFHGIFVRFVYNTFKFGIAVFTSKLLRGIGIVFARGHRYIIMKLEGNTSQQRQDHCHRSLNLWSYDDSGRMIDDDGAYYYWDDFNEAMLEYYREYYSRHYPYFGQGGTS